MFKDYWLICFRGLVWLLLELILFRKQVYNSLICNWSYWINKKSINPKFSPYEVIEYV